MGTAFHLFPLLPTELQLRIWELAVVDRRVAGANFFSIARLGPCLSFQPPPCGPTCDGCSRDAMLSWEHRGSRSLADGGLWDACYASREVMKKMLATLGLVLDESSCVYDGQEDSFSPMTGLAANLRETGPRSALRRFTVMPAKDLFVLDLAGLKDILRMDYSVDRSLSPFWSAKLSFLKHVAFEVNPAWLLFPSIIDGRRAGEWAVLTLVNAIMGMERGATFHLIDYRLRRRSACTARGQTTDTDGMVFYATGGRFIEAKKEDEWNGGHVALLQPAYAIPPIFAFAAYLQRLACRPHAVARELNFKVLAWESD